jgi:plastocyanin
VKTHIASLLLVSAFCISGCKKSAGPTPDATVDAPVKTVDPATAGAISGMVDFDGAAPKRVAIDMSMDPACAFATTPNLTEQVLVTDHKLANVYVYVKAGIPASSAPSGTAPVVLDQKGCRYIPHVIALQQGGSVEFKNSDPTMHNVHTTPTDGSAPVDVSEGPMGAPQTQKFATPQTMLPVRCNNHPWMNAMINVAPNPYFAVTGADGSFTIPNLPPGTYTLAAVHETLGEQDIQVTVSPKATAAASFTYKAK